MPTVDRKRQRQSKLKRWKTFSEKEILECYFMLDPFWSRKTIIYLKSMVKLSEEQIYKWGYEKKRKIKSDPTSPLAKLYESETRTENLDFEGNVDYNSVVDELFPAAECVSDELTLDERRVYDKLRAELTSKDTALKNLNDLDKLLCERMSISDLILNAKGDSFVSGIKEEQSQSKTGTHPSSPQKSEAAGSSGYDKEQNEATFSFGSTSFTNKRCKKLAEKSQEISGFDLFAKMEEEEVNQPEYEGLLITTPKCGFGGVDDDVLSFF